MADGLSAHDLAGKFAFRFSGFSMKNSILFYLAGVGQFEIAADGKLSGDHRSSLTPLQGQKAKLAAGRYKLTGEISLTAGAGSAKIHFADQMGQGLDLDGEFYVVAAGSADRLWFVSSRDVQPGGIPADELVNLEAIRMADD